MATGYRDNSVTSTKRPSTRRFENVKKESDPYILIWLDKNVNASEDNIRTQNRLRQIISQLVTFEDMCAWINSSINLAARKVILLVSESYTRLIVPVIHSFPQVIAIYVYSLIEIPATWTINYKKVSFVVEVVW